MKLLSKILSIGLLVVVLLTISILPTQAVSNVKPNTNMITVRTTVFSVTQTGNVSGVPTCTIYLQNGGKIFGAWGTDCQARKGRGVVLNYEERLVDDFKCNLVRCWQVQIKQRVLNNWYLK